MTEEKLKTLKDLQFYTGGWEEDGTISRCYFINGKELREELKEEAKKWIDTLTEEHHQLNDGYETTLERNFNSNRGCSVSDDGSVCDICHTLRWIKMFFDLEEL